MKDEEALGKIGGLLGALLLISLVSTGILNYWEEKGVESALISFWLDIKNYFLENIWPVWIVLSAIFSVLIIAGIIRNLGKIKEINAQENRAYKPEPLKASPSFATENPPKIREANEGEKKWRNILEYTNSSNPSEWRIAIIEADVMLETLLRSKGLPGDSVGDMLKSVDRNDINSLDDAWEAHKIRNDIAHSGSGFQLNERETKRTIAMYEKVFKEFGVI